MEPKSEPNEQPKTNPDLERLAAQAQAEDKAPEDETVNESTGELQTVSEQDAEAKEAAIKLAGYVVSGLEFGVGTIWGVEYPEKTKGEAVAKLAPCLSGGGEPPKWLTSVLGRYGHVIEAGVFFGAVGFSTYKTIQQRESEEETSESRSHQEPAQSQPRSTEPTQGFFGSDGER